MIALALLLLALLAAAPADARAPSLEWLYMEPNEGGSSAGHVAVALGAQTFAFQRSDDGLLVLERDDSAHVRFLYAMLGNRAVHRSRIAIGADAFERLREAFTRRYLVQQRHLAARADVAADRRLLRALLAEAPSLPVPAAGYFAPGRSDALAALRRALVAAHGPDFLARRTAALRARLAATLPRPSDLPPAALAPDAYPAGGASFAARYTAVLAGIVALELVDAGARLDPAATATVVETPLTAGERRALARMADDLEGRLVRLAASPRADFGVPLLIGMARLAAVEASLAAGRLVVLDAFPEGERRLPAAAVARAPAVARGFLADARAELDRSRRALTAAARPGERDYVRVESAANRAVELRRAIDESRDVRLASGPLVPARAGVRPSADAVADRAVLARALATTDAAAAAHADALSRLYRYDLIRRNCVTETFRTIDAALGPDAETALGGRIAADGGWRFIPKVADHAVATTWRVAEREVVPSHRQAALAALAADGNRFLVRLRESNVLTATLYRPSRDDSTFLFFTDDVLVLRPLLGAANLGVGVGAAVAGLARAPFDRGERLAAGLRGILWSLPELAFLNVRKGSYDYLPRPGTDAAAAAGTPAAAAAGTPAAADADPKLSMNATR